MSSSRFGFSRTSAGVCAKVPLIERLEERVLFALAGTGYSGTLSSNASIRKQQLICDPAEPKEGSTSVRYDPSVVTLSGVIPGPGYDNLGFIGLIEVRSSGGNTILQPLVAWLNNRNFEETGYVQIRYKLQGNAGQLAPPSGYSIIEEDGATGVDTHAFFFDLKPGVPLTANAQYSIFAAHGATFSNNQEDYLVSNDGLNTRSGPDDLAPAFVSSNRPPEITSTGGPYTIAEGSGLVLSATATDEETPGSLTYAWDLNNDNTDDVFGANPTVPAGTLALLGLDDGGTSLNMKLTVSDGDKEDVELVPLTITNVAPTAGTPALVSTLGALATLNLTAGDPSSPDRTAGFTYLVNWGDGSPVQTISPTAGNGSGVNINHTYNSLGSFTASVQAMDKDGDVSATMSTSISVSGAMVCPDPAYPGKLALCVIGTDSADTIRFLKSGNAFKVTIATGASTTTYGPFSGFDRIITRGLGGNDDVRLDFKAAAEVLFFGGDGNDTLIAGNFLSLLSGGEGDDYLSSGNAKDLVVGGGGKDTLLGGDGDDLVMAGRTSFDVGVANDVIALSAIFREWNSGNSYEQRIARITGAAVSPLGTSLFKPGVSAFDDNALDTVYGGKGRDWLLLNRVGGILDDPKDWTSTETITEL